MQLKRNIIANYLGQGWSAFMGIAFIPLYIKYLGMEAYGLIGFFALLQIWLSLLDMGMTPTLGREMARFTANGNSSQQIRDLLRSVELIVFGIALLMASAIALGAGWISTHWVKVEKLPFDVVAEAFTAMGLITAIRFIEGIYHSSIVGLQKHIISNVIIGTMATLRSVGAVAVLAWISPTIQAFFIWQGLVSIIGITLLATITYANLPVTERGGRFSLVALNSVWQFTGGMIAITSLTMVLTQVDKILLSNLLPLSDYGYYTLAATLAGALYVAIRPITQAVYPRLCQLQADGNFNSLAATYHKGAQLVSVIAGTIAILFIFYSETILHLWTQNSDIAGRAGLLVSILMLGNLLNGVMWMPQQAQLAHGWTSLSVRINFMAALLIVPAIMFVTPLYGPVGAASIWVLLNVVYVTIEIHCMHKKILRKEKLKWYWDDTIKPIGAALLFNLSIALVTPKPIDSTSALALLGLASVGTILASGLSAETTRNWLVKQFNRVSN